MLSEKQIREFLAEEEELLNTSISEISNGVMADQTKREWEVVQAIKYIKIQQPILALPDQQKQKMSMLTTTMGLKGDKFVYYS